MPPYSSNAPTTIVRQVDDIKRMVDEFSRFARMPKAVIAAEDVADTVRQVVFLMRVGHPDIDFDVELPAEAMPARFDRRLISQALTNIIKNATEAIGAVPPAELGTRPHHGQRAARRQGRRHRRDRQRHRPAEGEPRAAARALRDDAREGHRTRARHRRPHSRGAWRHASSCATRRRKIPGARGAWMQLRFAAEPIEAPPSSTRTAEQRRSDHGVRYPDR